MERLRLNSVSNLTLKVEIDGIKVEKVNGRVVDEVQWRKYERAGEMRRYRNYAN